MVLVATMAKRTLLCAKPMVASSLDRALAMAFALLTSRIVPSLSLKYNRHPASDKNAICARWMAVLNPEEAAVKACVKLTLMPR